MPFSDGLLTVSFFILTVPDCYRHRRFAAGELRVVLVTIGQRPLEPARLSPHGRAPGGLEKKENSGIIGKKPLEQVADGERSQYFQGHAMEEN